jgi:hypothetical protein
MNWLGEACDGNERNSMASALLRDLRLQQRRDAPSQGFRTVIRVVVERVAILAPPVVRVCEAPCRYALARWAGTHMQCTVSERIHESQRQIQMKCLWTYNSKHTPITPV